MCSSSLFKSKSISELYKADAHLLFPTVAASPYKLSVEQQTRCLFNKVIANPWNLLWSWICYSSTKGRGNLIFPKPELFSCALTTLHMSVACFYDDTTTFAHNSVVSQVLLREDYYGPCQKPYRYTNTTLPLQVLYLCCCFYDLVMSCEMFLFEGFQASTISFSLAVEEARSPIYCSCTWGHCLNQARATWEDADEGVLSAVPWLDPPFFIYYYWPWWEQMLLDLCPNGRPKTAECDGVLTDM